MIAGVKGTIDSLGSDWVIVDVGGISFQVFVPTSTLSTLGVGQSVKLHTYLHIREDNMSLYGFGSARELSLFQTVTSVSGVGPRLGLTMLSAMDADQLTTTIASGDADMLTTIPGVGKKTANRIILELKDKIGSEWIITQDIDAVQGKGEVVSALVSLGYTVTEATRAVRNIPSDSRLGLEEKIKLALQSFGTK